jgi:hypothetical protein
MQEGSISSEIPQSTRVCPVPVPTFINTKIMSVINLGPLGRFEIRRQRSASPEMSSSESTPLIATHNEAPPHIMSPAHEVPPPYSVIARNNLGLFAIRRASERQTPKGSERLEREEKATIHELPRNGPGKARKPACPQRQLRRYMLEIIALTFDADFDVLNNALHDDKSIQNTTSILSAEERKDLLVLSKLVGKALRLNNAVSRRRPLPISDRNRLQEAIVGPDEGFQGDIFEGFALDMIGWYSEPLPYPVPWGKTIPGNRSSACSLFAAIQEGDRLGYAERGGKSSLGKSL